MRKNRLFHRLLILLFIAGPPACVRKAPLPHIPRSELTAYFSRLELSAKNRHLLGQFEKKVDEDPTAARELLRRNRLRFLYYIFPTLLDQELARAAGLIDSTGSPEPRVLVAIADFLAEVCSDAGKSRYVRFCRDLSPEQILRACEARYGIAKGRTARREKAFQQALSALEKARAGFAEIGDVCGQALAAYWIGRALSESSKYGAALEAFRSSERLARRAGDTTRRAWSLLRIGEMHMRRKEYAECEASLLACIEENRRLFDPEIEIKAKRFLGYAKLQVGEHLEALDLLRGSQRLSDSLALNFETVNTLGYLGIAMQRTGDYNGSLQAYRRALQIYQQHDMEMESGYIYNNIGTVFTDIGDFEQAKEYYSAALERHRKFRISTQIALVSANLGEVLSLLGNYREAERHFNAALAAIEDSTDRATRAVIFQMMAESYRRQRKWDLAARYYQRSYTINSALNDRANLIKNLLGLGHIALEQGQMAQAEFHFKRAIMFAKSSGIDALLWQGHYGRGLALQSSGAAARALDEFSNAVTIIESERHRLQSEELRISYFIEKQKVFDAMIQAQLETKRDTALAFQYMERARARSFLDMLRGGVEVVKQQDMLRRDRKTLRLLSPAVVSVPETWEIQAELPPETVLLAYRLFRNKLGIWVMNSRKLRFTAIEVPRTYLEKLVGEFRVAIGADSSKAYRAILNMTDRRKRRHSLEPLIQRMWQSSVALSNVLLAPVWEQVRGARHVFVIPDDVLHYLPFAALVVPRADGRRFLIEKVAISYAQSASTLYSVLSRRVPSDAWENASALIVADPGGDLPGAKKIAATISEYFDSTHVFTGATAQKDSILRALQGPHQLVHFSTHCAIDERNPLFSSLLLSSAQQDSRVRSLTPGRNRIALRTREDRLYMHEVFGLKMPSVQLVVLAACETAMGRFARGEGIVGLPRAFMYAGVPGLLLTLWKVDDMAAEQLMQRFYRHFWQHPGQSARPLQLAQIDAIKSWRRTGFYFHTPLPYFWAAFISFGNPGPARPVSATKQN